MHGCREENAQIDCVADRTLLHLDTMDSQTGDSETALIPSLAVERIHWMHTLLVVDELTFGVDDSHHVQMMMEEACFQKKSSNHTCCMVQRKGGRALLQLPLQDFGCESRVGWTSLPQRMMRCEEDHPPLRCHHRFEHLC